MNEKTCKTNETSIFHFSSSGKEAANAAAGTNWRQPDAVIKKGAKLSAAKKAKMIQQMAALRQQILGDYNKNTKAGDKALLMGPNSL